MTNNDRPGADAANLDRKERARLRPQTRDGLRAALAAPGGRSARSIDC